jgi:hypothetical protein
MRPDTRQQLTTCSSHPAVSTFPDSTFGSACTSSFSRLTRRSLALRPAHSRRHHIRDSHPRASDISSPPCLPRLLPAGAVAGLASHPLENTALHGARGKRSFAQARLNVASAPLHKNGHCVQTERAHRPAALLASNPFPSPLDQVARMVVGQRRAPSFLSARVPL